MMPLTKDSRLLRIGVLGCGPISQAAHFDACHKARNAQLYAICDAAEDLLARMAAVWEPTVSYSDYDAMLADGQLEAVIIAVADEFHVPLAIRALYAGKHVLIEKPMGINVEECLRLRKCVRESGLQLQIGNNRRFDPGMILAKRFVDTELGRRIAIKAWYRDSFYRYTMTNNLQPVVRESRSAIRPSGDPKSDRRRYYMLGHGSHLVDTARYLGGDIESVRARFLERCESYCWFVEVQFADDGLGHLELLIPARGDFEEGFTIFGEHGGVSGRLYLPWYRKASVVECFSAKDRTYRRTLGEDAYTYKLQIEGFAESILDGVPQHGASVDDGIAAMRAMAAIARSVETGEAVKLCDARGSI